MQEMTEVADYPMEETEMQQEPKVRARASDPWTSWEAAKSVAGTKKTRAEVLYVLRKVGPCTHEQLISQVRRAFGPKHSESGVRTRCAELVEMGAVKDSGETARTVSGRRTIVWEATK